MKRKDFIRQATALGLGTALLPTWLAGCNSTGLMYGEFEVNFTGKVIVIGAGTAGLFSGYLLNKNNIDFQILEASSVYGGRVKGIEGFADFPIDLGAEWIHDDPSILAMLVNDKQVEVDVDIINYSPETLYIWRNEVLRKRNFFANFYGEYKFKNTTWFDYLDSYIAPSVRDQILYNQVVNEIDYSTDKVIVKTQDDSLYEADKVILTVPLTVLKKRMINFMPSLPSEKITALGEVDMPDGIKIFLEFSERFYPDMLGFESIWNLAGGSSGEKIYYDAAFRKDSDRNVLGLFTVGEPASIYTQKSSEEELMDFVMNELDTIFEGKPSRFYQQHIVQNWSKEPFIQGSYSHYDNESTKEILTEPIDNKIFFAGEAHAPRDDATVHGAGKSAYVAVEKLLLTQ